MKKNIIIRDAVSFYYFDHQYLLILNSLKVNHLSSNKTNCSESSLRDKKERVLRDT